MGRPIIDSVSFMVARGHVVHRGKQSLLILSTIALGVAAVIMFLSIANGFQADLTERVLGLTSHVVVVPTTSPTFEDSSDIKARVQSQLSDAEVVGISASFFSNGLLGTANGTKSIQLRGVVPEDELTVSPSLAASPLGRQGLGTNEVIVGKGVLEWLGLSDNDSVSITFPSGQSGLFSVAGVFESGVSQYDNNFAYLSLAAVQGFLNRAGSVTEIRIRLHNPYHADSVANGLRQALPGIDTITWRQLNRSLFEALVLEKRVFALVLSLMLVISGFGIANVMGMHVVQRQRDIAILSTMGLSVPKIRRIFLLQGAALGLVGAALGCTLGVVAAKLVNMFGLPLPGDIYPIDTIPIQIRVLDVLLAVSLGVLVSLIASYFPARRISATLPVEVLRHG